MNMEMYNMATYLIIPAAMLVLGIFLGNKPPKWGNRFIGYRTKRSKKTEATWEFSQKIFAKVSVNVGFILLLGGLIVTAVGMHLNVEMQRLLGWGTLIAYLVGLFYSFIKVENALNLHFDKNGKMKKKSK